MQMVKLWFSLFDRSDYKSELPYFIEGSTEAYVEKLESNYAVIKEELLAYLQKNELTTYFNSTMVEKKNTWKTISLNSWDINLYHNFIHFPKTTALIKSFPEIVSSSFTMLAANSRIKPHCGDTNGIYRCHLGLVIPAGLPSCGFRVGEEWRSWEEGKVLRFIDANNHEAINLSDQNRFIFLFDVIRPEVRRKKGFICAVVRTSLFMQRMAERMPSLYKCPLSFQMAIAGFLVPLAYTAIPVRNFIYKNMKW
ncbi:MAG: hypothetical protein K0R26_2285 [Bacteroidota bacterium]|jgi:aspartyl/asparaginyl beta-hydroxylase (cupin superfamily)|nr:hypothetical protein [Bacteroidota bacterium]